MSVVIYGLYSPDFQTIEFEKLDGWEHWVLNDWYQFNGIKNPDRIYNLHSFPHVNVNEDRFTGNWKKEYNDSNALVIATEKITDIWNCELLQTESLVEFAGSRSALSCSIATMIWNAIFDGHEGIVITGVPLNKQEHAYQAAGIINAIDYARCHGIDAMMYPFGREKEIRSRLNTIPPMGLMTGDIDLTYWEWHRELKKLKYDLPNGQRSINIKGIQL